MAQKPAVGRVGQGDHGAVEQRLVAGEHLVGRRHGDHGPKRADAPCLVRDGTVRRKRADHGRVTGGVEL